MNQYKVTFETKVSPQIFQMNIVAESKMTALKLFEDRVLRYKALDSDAYNIINVNQIRQRSGRDKENLQ